MWRAPRMLAVLFSGTRTMIKGTTQIRDANTKHGLGKTINLHYTAIFEETVHQEDVEKSG